MSDPLHRKRVLTRDECDRILREHGEYPHGSDDQPTIPSAPNRRRITAANYVSEPLADLLVKYETWKAANQKREMAVMANSEAGLNISGLRSGYNASWLQHGPSPHHASLPTGYGARHSPFSLQLPIPAGYNVKRNTKGAEQDTSEQGPEMEWDMIQAYPGSFKAHQREVLHGELKLLYTSTARLPSFRLDTSRGESLNGKSDDSSLIDNYFKEACSRVEAIYGGFYCSIQGINEIFGHLALMGEKHQDIVNPITNESVIRHRLKFAGFYMEDVKTPIQGTNPTAQQSERLKNVSVFVFGTYDGAANIWAEYPCSTTPGTFIGFQVVFGPGHVLSVAKDDKDKEKAPAATPVNQWMILPYATTDRRKFVNVCADDVPDGYMLGYRFCIGHVELANATACAVTGQQMRELLNPNPQLGLTGHLKFYKSFVGSQRNGGLNINNSTLRIRVEQKYMYPRSAIANLSTVRRPTVLQNPF